MLRTIPAMNRNYAKYILLISLLSLLACANPRTVVADAASKCPQIGIDIAQPDFYQKHKRSDVEKFYGCMEAALKPSGHALIFGQQGSPGRELLNQLSQGEDTKASILPALVYQRNLWRQVLSKEKPPGAAYEAWVHWVQAEQSIAASNQAAASAEDASNAAQQQQFQTNFQLQQQNMQLQQIQQQQLINNSMSGRY